MTEYPENSWVGYKSLVKRADKIMAEVLNDRPIGHWLETVIHNMIWHEGDCVARWINDNKELVAKLNKADSGEDFDALKNELDLSVRKLNRLKNR